MILNTLNVMPANQPVAPEKAQRDVLARSERASVQANKGKSFSRELDRASEKNNVTENQDLNNSPESKSTQPRATNTSDQESVDAQSAVTKKTGSQQSASSAMMSRFLMQMQNEYGVTPEDILSSFSQLSENELSSNPEQSAEAFIAGLNLNEADSKEALDLYYDMLVGSAAVGTAAAATTTTAPARDMKIQVMDTKDERINKLHKSLDVMNDKFFKSSNQSPIQTMQQPGPLQSLDMNSQNAQQALMNGKGQPDAFETQISSKEAALLDQSLPAQGADGQTVTEFDTLNKNGELLNAKAKPDATSLAKSNSEQLAGGSQANANSATVMNSNQSLSQANSQAASEFTKTMQQQTYPKMNQATANQMPDANLEPVKGFNNQATDSANQIVNDSSAKTLAGNQSTDSGQLGSQNSEQDNKQEISSDQMSDLTQSQKTVAKNEQFVLNGPKPTPAEMQANVKEIISQAQFLADKGGGEMKISLNPEGMGEVKLKVKAVDGQINVEMITSSSESKKLLEKGLSELKDNLAAHKLNLDTVRIETGKEISNQLDQRQQGDFDRQQQQQRFLHDFRERNQSMRHEMFELGAPSRPSSQTRDQASNSIYNTNAKRNKNSSSAQSRRLDLVA